MRADDTPRPVRVLFIGNSYTYFNNLPVMLERVAASVTPPRRIETKMVVEGGATLRRLWEQKKALGVIQNEQWDYVVLQEQSTLGVNFMIEGVNRITDYAEFHKSVRRFDEAIRARGAKTVLYATWARKEATEQDQAMLDYAYVSIAKELHALVAPVGIVWQAVRKAKPDLELYNRDGSHPSPAGTYLAASCFLATLLNVDPTGAAAEITGPAVDVEGQANRDRRLAKLDQPTASLLQSEAWKIHSSLAKSDGYPDVAKPAPPQLPSLPAGDPIKPEALEGHWVGTTKLYPRFFLTNTSDWPGKMELTCTRQNGTWEFTVTVALVKALPSTPQKATNIMVQDKSLSFDDSARVINGASPTYRAILKDGKLLGIAEMKSKEMSYFAIGTWELHKE